MNQTVTAVATEVDLGSSIFTDTKQLPMVVTTTSDVGEKAELIDTSRWPASRLREIEQQAAEFDIMNTAAILTFAAEPQRDLTRFLDTLIEGIKTKDAGMAGLLAMQLNDGIDLMALDKVHNQVANGVGVVGRVAQKWGFMVNYVRAFYEKQELIKAKFDEMERKAQDQMAVLHRESESLDSLVERSGQQILALEQWIVYGDHILQHNKEQYAVQAERAKQAHDVPAASRLRDMARAIQAFDTRLLRVKEAYIEAGALTIQRIRLIQEGISIEIQELSDGILFELPRLKLGVVQVAALNETKRAQEGREQMGKVSRRLDNILDQSAEETFRAAKQAQGAGLERVQRLQGQVDKVLGLVQKGVELELEAQQRRDEAGRMLVALKEKTIATLEETAIEAL